MNDSDYHWIVRMHHERVIADVDAVFQLPFAFKFRDSEMTVTTIIPASREDWLLLRHPLIGCSETPVLHGVGFITPYELYHKKKGNLPPDRDTKNKRRGRRRETLGLEWFAEDRPDLIVTANTIPGGVYFVDEDARMGATPDGFAREREEPLRAASLQVKDVPKYTFATQWHREGQLEPPLHVAIQANDEACMAGADYAIIIALVCNDEEAEVYPFELPLNRRLFEKSKALIADFWRRIETDEPYDPDFGRDADIVKAVYAGDDSTIDLSGSNRLAELVAEREALNAQERSGAAAAKERKEKDAEILHMLGNASAAIAPGGRLIEVTTVHRKAYQSPAVTYPQVRIKAGTVALSPARLAELA